MITIYHQIKTLINFWYKRRSNYKSLIQPLETLLVKLTGTHHTILHSINDITYIKFGLRIALSNNFFLLITKICIYIVVIPTRSKTVRQNRPVPKYSVLIDKLEHTPK